MDSEQERRQLARLRYGFKSKIFKRLQIVEASIYLDPLYDNFLWIATNDNTFLLDLCFTTITFYSLELELQIKYQSKYNQQIDQKYIVLKQLNTEVPIIFNEQKSAGYSSEQNLKEFVQGRKPIIFDAFENFINEKKKLCKYSPNFSRYFKKMRISLELESTQSFMQFSQAQITNALNSIQQLASIQKENLFEPGKKLFPTDVIDVLKVLYCRLNSTLLKSMSTTSNVDLRKSASKKYMSKEEEAQTDFMVLMQLQNGDINYVIPEYKINPDLPLTDYFCFSSHNTYLTGNQITSDCKISRYIEDLKKGIKCVELDVHNKGDNEPIITHAIKGKGFCKPITFRATIQSIDEYLEYNRDHYPIIFSIQNHASRQNQDLMNNILRKQFPKNILIPNDKNQFYKLSQTKGKIIIKTSCNLQSLIQFKNNDQVPKIKSYDVNNFTNGIGMSDSERFLIKQTKAAFFTNSLHTDSHTDSQNSPTHPQTQNNDYRKFMDKIKVYQNLKLKFNQRIDQNSYLPVEKIVQITCLFKAPKGIQTPKTSPFECSSMQNTKIEKTAQQKIINYTKRSWLRSYPQGTEIYSKNYQLMGLLARGVQIIALNTQTNDDYAIMMNSYFRAGRKNNMAQVGYVEKPQYLRNIGNNTHIAKYPNQQRNYEFAFYTNHQLQFDLHSLDKAKLQQKTVMDNVKRISFSLSYYNESFLIIKIANKKWIECLPLRFLPFQSEKVYKTIFGRDYEFQDTGIRIVCSIKWTKQ